MLTYAKMNYKVTEEKQLTYNGYTVVDLRMVRKEELETLYHLAFSAGDHHVYKSQSEEEKKSFYHDSLGLPLVLRHFASHGIMKEDTLVGYTFIADTDKKQLEIKCMVVHPDHQNKGIGYLMLKIINNKALDYGYEYIQLNTEPDKKAFHLYDRFGFETLKDA